MARELRNAVLVSEVRALFGFGVVRDLSDRQLLERFLTADHADAEAAFTFLVDRHGPMVLHVCRQVLDGSHDAQDAFQATFLVFLRRAKSIRKHDSLASWLFGVAMRVARRAQHAAIVRRIHERNAGDLVAATSPSTDGHIARLAALHNEIARLPDRYREPIVLCHLEGLSTAAAAQRLGCPQGTILSRLARGRERLRRRLSPRGQVESMELLVATWGRPEPTKAPPAALVTSTVQYAVRALTGRAALAASISPSVAALTQATLRTVFMTRMLLAGALLSTAAVITLVTIPVFRPSLIAGSQATSIDKGPKEHGKPQTIEQKSLYSRDLEDALYKLLKRDHEFNEPRWPFVIKVRDVQDKRLIDATFKHRTKGLVNEYDAIIQAKRAVLRFDLNAKIVRAFLEHAEVQHFSRDADMRFGDTALIDNETLEIPIPPGPEPQPEFQMEMMDSDQTLSLVYSSDGKMLATAGFDGAVHLWDMIEAKEVATLKGANSTIRAVAFSSDGKALACVNDTGDAKIWDVATGTLTKSLPGLSEPMREARGKLSAIAFAPDGELLAIAGQAQFKAGTLGYIYEVRILEVQSGQSRWSHMGRGEGAMSLAFSPDGEVLASAGWRSVKLWNSQTGEPVRNLSPTRGGIYSAAFTPDGRTLLGGGIVGPASPDGQQPAGTITLWDVGQGRILNTLEGQTRHVRVLAIAHNGKTVASGGWGPIRTFGNEQRIVSEVRLWDIGTGRLIWTFEGKSGEIGSLAFALDGNTLVYCDHDAVGVINVETGKLERTLTKTTRTPSKP